MDWFNEAKELLANGLLLKEISQELNIPYKTVQRRFHRDNTISHKIGKEERKPSLQTFEDYYIINAGSGDNARQIKITKDKLRLIKQLYCDSNSVEINTLCRKVDIPRQDFFAIKTAFSITHNDVPALDEDLTDDNIDNIVTASLERRKEQFFQKQQEQEVKLLRKEVEDYRKQDYFINKIHTLTTEHMDKFEKTYRAPIILTLPKRSSGKLFELPIVDLHLGKLAWQPETGENYDYKIAEERFMFVVHDNIEKTKNIELEKTVFLIGNDFFNFDTIDGTTTLGTQQDNDVRWQKLYAKGTEMLIRAVDMLATISPVHVVLCPGNHDKMTSFYAADKIATWFRNNPNVTFDISPKTRKYVAYGKCLIGYTHMDKEKKRIEGNMQLEVPEMWGNSVYREWHGGHLHSEQVREVNGIKIRNLSSVTGTDAWHYESGYTGSLAVNQSFIWDKELGLENILFSTVRR